MGKKRVAIGLKMSGADRAAILWLRRKNSEYVSEAQVFRECLLAVCSWDPDFPRDLVRNMEQEKLRKRTFKLRDEPSITDLAANLFSMPEEGAPAQASLPDVGGQKENHEPKTRKAKRSNAKIHVAKVHRMRAKKIPQKQTRPLQKVLPTMPKARKDKKELLSKDSRSGQQRKTGRAKSQGEKTASALPG
jgi:hypothetical protein